MELQKFGERLAKLRAQKNVSARKMSLFIGVSANYINKIENGKTFPSMHAFFEICEYLEISPKDFFDDGNDQPVMVKEMVGDYVRLDSTSQSNIAEIVKELARDN